MQFECNTQVWFYWRGHHRSLAEAFYHVPVVYLSV